MRVVAVWNQLPASHRRWIIYRALLVAAAFNVVITAAIAWISVRTQETVPMWGLPLIETSTFWNVIGTLFLLPLITCTLTTTAIRRDIRSGSLSSVSHLRSGHRWLSLLPPNRLRRGAIAGVVAVVALAPPVILALLVLGFPDLTRDQFVAGQTAFAVVLGALITPVMALYVMADPDRYP